MIDHIRPAALSAWLQSHASQGPAVVLDVREPWECQTASVPESGFALLRIPMGQLPARIRELDPGHPVACLCHHGARSLQVAHFLKGHGFSRVANITGGIHAWSAECDAAVPTY